MEAQFKFTPILRERMRECVCVKKKFSKFKWGQKFECEEETKGLIVEKGKGIIPYFVFLGPTGKLVWVFQ